MAQGALVALTTAPTVIAGSGTHGVIVVKVRNRGSASVYLGGSDVTTAGFPLTTADSPLELRVMVGETLYGTSTGSISIDVLRMNETT
jgi:hypothetical protein